MTNYIVTEDLERIQAGLPDLGKFQGATVLITGFAGFLGFYFTQFFVRHAARLGIQKVIGLDTFLIHKPRWVTDLVTEFPDVLDVHAFDISKDRIDSIPGAEDARYVIHGASIASPTYYRLHPLETIDANIWGMRALLEAYKSSKTLKGFLFFSSSEIYGDPDPAHIPTEESYNGNVSCVGPRACYDESKRFGETLCEVFAKKYGMPITVARPFNNFGPGMQLGDKRVPADFARCVLENKDIVIHSDGTPTRTFCYVSDAVTGYLLCLLHGRFDAFNIGIEMPEITVRELAELYRQAGSAVFGYTGKVVYEASRDKDYLTHNPNRRCPIIAKARDVLGYAPSIQADEGVMRYLAFLKHEQQVSR